MTVCLALLTAAAAGFYFWASSGASGGAESYAQTDRFLVKSTLLNGGRASREPGVYCVMTFNIGYLSGMTNNTPVKTEPAFHQENLDTFLFLLGTVTPDIIAFQEIDFHSRRSHYVDQYREIAQRAGFPYGARAINWDKRYVPFPYGWPSSHFGPILSGQAVLSRHLIVSTERIVLEKPEDNPFYYNAFYLDRLLQAVAVKIADRRVLVLNVHLEAFSETTRLNQVKKVLEYYRRYRNTYSVLLMGDFNAPPPEARQKNDFVDEPGADYSHDHTIREMILEASLEAAELKILTFPSSAPTRKLDYIFFDRERIASVSATAYEINSSDHLPLVMEFRFK